MPSFTQINTSANKIKIKRGYVAGGRVGVGGGGGSQLSLTRYSMTIPFKFLIEQFLCSLQNM